MWFISLHPSLQLIIVLTSLGAITGALVGLGDAIAAWHDRRKGTRRA